jgi:hypothetical protein
MAWYVLLRPLRPELDGQDPFQICGRLCQTRKPPTLVTKDLSLKIILIFPQKIVLVNLTVRGQFDRTRSICPYSLLIARSKYIRWMRRQLNNVAAT